MNYTVSITELETELLSVFVKKKILDQDTIIRTMRVLIEKLKISAGKEGD